MHRFGDLVAEGVAGWRGRSGEPPVGRPWRRGAGPAAGGGWCRDRGAPAGAEGPARLDVEGVVVDFGGLLALDCVDLVAEPGSIVGLIGANGSGKTTLLDVISGLVRPSPARCGSTA